MARSHTRPSKRSVQASTARTCKSLRRRSHAGSACVTHTHTLGSLAPHPNDATLRGFPDQRSDRATPVSCPSARPLNRRPSRPLHRPANSLPHRPIAQTLPVTAAAPVIDTPADLPPSWRQPTFPKGPSGSGARSLVNQSNGRLLGAGLCPRHTCWEDEVADRSKSHKWRRALHERAPLPPPRAHLDQSSAMVTEGIATLWRTPPHKWVSGF